MSIVQFQTFAWSQISQNINYSQLFGSSMARVKDVYLLAVLSTKLILLQIVTFFQRLLYLNSKLIVCVSLFLSSFYPDIALPDFLTIGILSLLIIFPHMDLGLNLTSMVWMQVCFITIILARLKHLDSHPCQASLSIGGHYLAL
jgi:hypothetical protein